MFSGKRILSVLFIIAAFGTAIGYFVYAGLPAISPEGASDRDEIVLVCLKCQQESVVKAAAYAALDREGYMNRCPKCGEMAAMKAAIRCAKCKRALPPQPAGTAFVCPFCKAPLSPR